MEPLPTDHPFLKLDNTIIAPHLGYVTEEGYRAFYAGAIEDVRAYAAGEPVRVINRRSSPHANCGLKSDLFKQG